MGVFPEQSPYFIGKDRDPPVRDPLSLSLISLIKAMLGLTDSYTSLLSPMDWMNG